MQPVTTKRGASVVLKLGRYLVRCLTAQPDIWFMLYKCGQLITVNVHEPVARGVGILDELLQAQGLHQAADSDCTTAAIGSSASVTRPRPRCQRRPAATAAAAAAATSPDNDERRGMEDEDTEDTEDTEYTDDTESDSDDPFVFLAIRQYGSIRGARTTVRRGTFSCNDDRGRRDTSLLTRRNRVLRVGPAFFAYRSTLSPIDVRPRPRHHHLFFALIHDCERSLSEAPFP